MREASSPSGSLSAWALPGPGRPAHTHHAQVAQQPVAPGRLGEAAQPAAGDVEVPAEPQEPQQQVEEEEEQGEEERRHGIQAEGGLLQSQKAQHMFRDGQHPGGTTWGRGQCRWKPPSSHLYAIGTCTVTCGVKHGVPGTQQVRNTCEFQMPRVHLSPALSSGLHQLAGWMHHMPSALTLQDIPPDFSAPAAGQSAGKVRHALPPKQSHQ